MPRFLVFFQNFVANSVRIENDTRVYWTDLIKKDKNHRIPCKMEIAIRALYMEEYGAVALIIHKKCTDLLFLNPYTIYG